MREVGLRPEAAPVLGRAVLSRHGPLALALALACPSPARGDSSAEPAPLHRRRLVVDTHVHVGPGDVSRLHAILDAVGVDWVLNLSGLWPGGPLERQLAAAEASGRILVATNLPWEAASRADFPELAVGLLERARALGARALKVEKALGLMVTGPDGRLLAVDDPWLDPIWAAAGRLSLPVVIHTADPKAFWLPLDRFNERFEELSAHPAWSNHDKAVPSFEALLSALMRVVARHPRTTFVSVHFGNHAEDPAWVGEQLDRHPNLRVDLAARVPELGRHDAARLRALFIRHRSRILFGTDLGLGRRGFLMLGSHGKRPNRTEEIAPYFETTYAWLETAARGLPSPTPIQGRWTIDGLALPPDVLDDLYVNNAARVFGPPPRAALAGRGPPWFRLRLD